MIELVIVLGLIVVFALADLAVLVVMVVVVTVAVLVVVVVLVVIVVYVLVFVAVVVVVVTVVVVFVVVIVVLFLVVLVIEFVVILVIVVVLVVILVLGIVGALVVVLVVVPVSSRLGQETFTADKSSHIMLPNVIEIRLSPWMHFRRSEVFSSEMPGRFSGPCFASPRMGAQTWTIKWARNRQHPLLVLFASVPNFEPEYGPTGGLFFTGPSRGSGHKGTRSRLNLNWLLHS